MEAIIDVIKARFLCIIIYVCVRDGNNFSFFCAQVPIPEESITECDRVF